MNKKIIRANVHYCTLCLYAYGVENVTMWLKKKLVDILEVHKRYDDVGLKITTIQIGGDVKVYITINNYHEN